MTPFSRLDMALVGQDDMQGGSLQCIQGIARKYWLTFPSFISGPTWKTLMKLGPLGSAMGCEVEWGG
jgi:hypothetical protein